MQKIDLTTALQYGQAQGYPPLYSFLRQFTRENLQPNVPYEGGPDIALTCGNTDGLSKTLECLTNVWSEERDWIRERPAILCEEFAYMSAVQSCRPRGIAVVPVKMDMEGMLPTGPGGLEDILENWDDSQGRRPHLMYTVTLVLLFAPKKLCSRNKGLDKTPLEEHFPSNDERAFMLSAASTTL